jgi:sulfur carrier protein
MRITVNGKETKATDALSVSKLLTEFDVEMQEYVSVQMNDEIIPRSEFEERIVKDGDVVEFLYYMGGGSRIAAL